MARAATLRISSPALPFTNSKRTRPSASVLSASIVLGLVYLEQEMHLPGEATIRAAVMLTVLLSIFAQGLSAMPGIGLYARRISLLPANAPEHCPVRPI